MEHTLNVVKTAEDTFDLSDALERFRFLRFEIEKRKISKGQFPEYDEIIMVDKLLDKINESYSPSLSKFPEASKYPALLKKIKEYESQQYGGIQRRSKLRRNKSRNQKKQKRQQKQKGAGYYLEPDQHIGGLGQINAVHEPILPLYSPQPVVSSEVDMAQKLHGDQYDGPNYNVQPYEPKFVEDLHQYGGKRQRNHSKNKSRRHSRNSRHSRMRGGNVNPYQLSGLQSVFDPNMMNREFACSQPYWMPKCT